MVDILPDQDFIQTPLQQLARNQRYKRFAAVLDGHLAGREWIVGDQPTLADFAVGSCFIYAVAADLPLEPYAQVRRWYAKLASLPAWSSAVQVTPG